VDAVIDGERVKLAVDPTPGEKGVELQIRIALNAMGIMCMKHVVDNRNVRSGLGIGVADLICIVGPYGRFCAIEVKKPGYAPSDVRANQHRWLREVIKYGGVAGIAESVEEAMSLIDLARRLP